MEQSVYWQAVLERDSRFDGCFVYAVASTGIFCRPTCPARRPRRESVRFFTTAAQARAAGFRPCRRCHPEASEPPALTLVRHLCRQIEAHPEKRLTLADLGREAGMSPYHLQRLFKATVGLTPRQYAESCRLQVLKGELRSGRQVTEALYEAGYSSPSRLYEHSDAQLGMTPATYGRRGQGAHIRYGFTDSELGRLLVAATERGLCAVYLGDDDAALVAALVHEYSAATLEQDQERLQPWFAPLAGAVAGIYLPAELPVDLRGTLFQHRVWRYLRTIPAGATRSYGEVAAALGQPGAARAVARACASNQVALVIPCHRIVREDGAVGGYRWGSERKQQLLARERANR